MKGRHYFDAVPFAPLASDSGNRFSGPQQALERRRTQGDDHLGTNKRELAPQEWLAGTHFVTFGRAISGRAALDDVRDINVFAFHTNCDDDLVKQLTRTSNEWAPGGVLFSSRTFTHKHQSCLRVALTEYDCLAMLGKSAKAAVSDILPDRFKRGVTGF